MQNERAVFRWFICNLYTANEYAVVHALYISNKSTTATATVNIKVSTDVVHILSYR